MPAWKAPAFEVVETEFALEILVGAFGAPPLHHSADELPLGQSFGKSREEVVGRLRLVVAPLDEQPLRDRAVVMGNHASECESCAQVLERGLLPFKIFAGVRYIRAEDIDAFSQKQRKASSPCTRAPRGTSR